jgi:DedD protein
VMAEAPAPKKADDGARAQALLEGKPAAKPAASAPSGAGRYVVQIGAFAEDKTVREVRAKAQAAGIETFTQEVAVEGGKRTRVRLGPFGQRSEAEAAAAKVKKAGLPAAVVKL